MDTGVVGAAEIRAVARVLLDSSRCPVCGAQLRGPVCGNCGSQLTGPAAAQAWVLGTQAAEVLNRRDAVLQSIVRRATQSATSQSATTQPATTQPAATTPSAATMQPSATTQLRPPQPQTQHPPSLPNPPLPVRPRNKPSRWGVHEVLIGVGALLLAVAALGFLTFSWRVLPLAGRAALIGAVTVAVLGVSSWLRDRLRETAEAVGWLAVVLVLADAGAIRGTGLFGADRPDALVYSAGAAAVCAGLLGGWGLLTRVRAGSLAAAVLAPSAVILLAVHLDAQVSGALAVGALVVAAATVGRTRLPGEWQVERWVLRTVAAGALIIAIGRAVTLGTSPARLSETTVLLLVTAAVGLLQAVADRRYLALRRSWSLAGGLLIGSAAAYAGVVVDAALKLDDALDLLPVAALAAVSVALVAWAPGRRKGTAIRRNAVTGGAFVSAALTAVPVVIAALALQIGAAGAGLLRVWSYRPGASLYEADPLTTTGVLSLGSMTTQWVVIVIGLLVVGACFLVAAARPEQPGWLIRPLQTTGIGALGLLAIAAPLVPAAPIWAAVTVLLVISAATGTAAGITAARTAASGTRVTQTVQNIAFGAVSALSGVVAVWLAWTTRELSVPVTVIGIAALLLAHRTVQKPPARYALAFLASSSTLVVAGAVAGLAGAPMSTRLVWAAGFGALLAAGLITSPRPRWSGADRLAAAAPALFLLVSRVPMMVADGSGWDRRLLLAVTLVAVLAIAALAQAAVRRTFDLITPIATFLVVALSGLLATAFLPGARLSLLWAITAAGAAMIGTGLTMIGRLDQKERIAAELGATAAALVALAQVAQVGQVAQAGEQAQAQQLWPVLLLLGAAAAAIATAPDRRYVGWLAGILITGSTWTRLWVADVGVVEAYSLPPAAALLALAVYRIRKSENSHSGKDSDPRKLLTPVAALAVTPSIIASAEGTLWRPAVLMVVAVLLVGAGWLRQPRTTRLGVVLATIGALTSSMTVLVRLGEALGENAPTLAEVELWTLPAALLLLAHGALRREERSWNSYGPGLLLLLLPGLYLGSRPESGTELRQIIVIALAAVTLAIGARARLQAPVAIGGIVLIAQALVLLAPQIAALRDAVPVWGWVALVGLALLVLGAGYERRLEQLRALGLRLSALR